MSNLRRLILLGLFGGCGFAVAVCLAMFSDPSKEDPLKLPVPDAIHSAPGSQTDKPARIAAQSSDVGPPTSTYSNPATAGTETATASNQAHPRALPYIPTHPAVAPSHPPIAAQAGGGAAEPSIPFSAMMNVLKLLQPPNGAAQNNNAAQIEDVAPPLPQVDAATTDDVPPTTNLQKEGEDKITLTLSDSDIREVLELLSQGSGLNILATQNVKGTVTATLHDVDFHTALHSILRSAGYVAHRDGDIIFVGTADEFTVPAEVIEVATRIYRPNYITAQELEKLITPMLTPEVGAISISTAAETGIPSDSVTTGGDSYANVGVVLVRDYQVVLDQVDQIYDDVDIRPMQVAIEAMILSVKLADSNKLGVNFELLKDRTNTRIVSGVPPTALANIDVNSGGLKVGFLNGNTTVFVEALETIGDTNIIATPRLLALNKQKAEILIGSQLGYVNTTQTETAATQSVEFLEVGTQLRIRPFISTDGLIRMEVHPELSTGRVRVEGGFTLPDKDLTTVTTNVIAQDGSTVIIGGLIREDLDTSATQIPLLGSLPGVGFLFRQKTDKIDRREIIVLITPRILYDDELNAEGNHGAMEFHHRQAIRFEKLSPLSKRHISHNYFVKAQNAWADGRRDIALHDVNQAIHYDPENRAAIDLRVDIWEGNPVGDHTLDAPYRAPGPRAGPLDGATIEPWLIDQLDPTGVRQGSARHPMDRGVPGPRVQLMAPPAPRPANN